MKRLYSFILGILIGFTSCNEDFLILSPDTSVNSSSFYKTAEHFDQALIGSYEKLRSIALKGIFMDEMRSDNTFFTRYSGDRSPYLNVEVLSLFLDDETTAVLSENYNDVYSGIARLNTILSRINTSEMTDGEKNKVKAEALFLRSFYYFHLVQRWGPVSLMLTEVTTEKESFPPNSTVEAIYTQLVNDLNEAIEIGLPMPTRFPQSGRATQGAVKMLRAYVYMTKPTREYALAEQDLKDITKMGYGLESDYAKVFDPNNKNGKESIFEVQYLDGEGGQHNEIPWRYIPMCTNTDFLMGIRLDNYAGVSGGWAVPTKEMIQSYEPGDKRLSSSVYVAEGKLVDELFTVERVVKENIQSYTPPEGKGFRYFVSKYYHPPYTYAGRTGDNFPLYRYSGALLLLSECLVEQGKYVEALSYLNQVRERAGLNNLSIATKKNVSDEMRHELAFENHRWTDLVRTGEAISVMNEYGKEMKRLYGWILPSAFNVTQERLIFAFNKRELEINDQLVQNPGYKDY